jgi:hypothetical protein
MKRRKNTKGGYRTRSVVTPSCSDRNVLPRPRQLSTRAGDEPRHSEPPLLLPVRSVDVQTIAAHGRALQVCDRIARIGEPLFDLGGRQRNFRRL